MKTIEVCAGIIRNKNHQILTTQRMGGDFDGKWEFPGGKIEKGETHRETVYRELKEELNIEVDVGNHLITIEHQYPNFFLIMHCYWCNIKKGNIELLEHKDARWISRSELDSVDWIEADIDIVNKIKFETL